MTGSTIGIVGGGQLGRMLAMAAARLGFRVVILEPDVAAPAAQVANEHIVAAYDDEGALDRLAAQCDVVTYEFENVPGPAAERLAAAVELAPGVRPLAVSQDRLLEKDFVNSIGLETAAYRPVDSQDELESAALELFAAGAAGAIAKTRRFGYDGKGQLRLTAPAAGDDQVAVIPSDGFAQLGSVPSIVEGFIDFDCEISVICARGRDGSIACYPPARNEHRDGILASSVVPSGVSDALEAEAQDVAARLAEALEYVGVLGVELFVLPDASIVVNEFAPRVHNSGHWTELVCDVDQFEQHIRAISGLPLGATTARPCEMRNLIGDDVDDVPALLADGSWRVHLYGKSETRPGRKMGHATRSSPPTRS